jgi:hypothetical protein
MKILNTLDLTGNQIKNFLIDVEASAPTNYLFAGRLAYFSSHPYWHDGSSFNEIKKFSSSVVASTGVAWDSSGNLSTNGLNLTSFIKTTGTSISFQNSGGSSVRLTDIASPTAAGDATNKSYVDSMAVGLTVHTPVRVATTAGLSAYTFNTGTHVATASSNGALSIDSVAVTAGDRVLVKNESANAEYNGVYDVTQAGTAGTPWILTRSSDADEGATEVKTGFYVAVTAGAVNSGASFTLTTANPITLETTDLTFTMFNPPVSLSGTSPIQVSGLTISILDATNSSKGAIQVDTTNLTLSSGILSLTNANVLNAIGTLGVANGGTGRSTLTSNTVLIGNGTSSVGMVAAPTAGQVMIGDGTGVPKFTTLIGDITSISGTGSVLIKDAAITYAKMQTAGARKLLGNPTGSTAAVSEISLGTGLEFSGTSLQPSAITGGDVTAPAGSVVHTIGTNAVTVAKMQTLTARSVLGRSAATDGDMAAITAAVDGYYLKRSSGTLGFGAILASEVTSPGGLTTYNDTNVTISGGGGYASAFLQPISLTLGWSGQLAVARGGTGASTLTQYGVLIGNGTSAISALSVGITGQVLKGVSGAAPAFGALASTDLTDSSGLVHIAGTETITGQKTFSALLSANAGIYSPLFTLRNASLASRLQFWLSGTESGSNSGSNLVLSCYNDAGDWLNDSVVVTRSTGAWAFQTPPVIGLTGALCGNGSSAVTALTGAIGTILKGAGVGVAPTFGTFASTELSDGAVVHIAGVETITGAKTFSNTVTGLAFATTVGGVGLPGSGIGYVGSTAAYGLQLIGYGSTYDLTLLNRAGNVALGVSPNSTTIVFPAAPIFNSLTGVLCANSSSQATALTGASGTVLKGAGSGVAPAFGALATGDLPDLSGVYVTLSTLQTITGQKVYTSGNAFRFQNATNPGIEIASDATAAQKHLGIAYDTTSGSGFGSIQCTHEGTAFTPLVLNRYGGNVGINTASPSQALHVAGASLITGNSYLGDTSVYVKNNSSGLEFATGSATRSYISSTGYFGIGTISPSYKLDVTGDFRCTTAAYLNTTAVIGGGTALASTTLTLNSAAPVIGMKESDAGAGEYYIVVDAGRFNIRYGGLSNAAISVGSTGNVGIGAAAAIPSYPLDVAGQIHSSSVIDAAGAIAGFSCATWGALDVDNSFYNFYNGSWVAGKLRWGIGNYNVESGGSTGVGGRDMVLWGYKNDGSINNWYFTVNRSTGLFTVNGQVKSQTGGFVFPDGSIQTTAYSTSNQAKRYSANVGAITGGSALTVTHSLGTLDVHVAVREITGGALVFPDMAVTGVDTITLTFSSSASADVYRVTVIA